jgi:uncharacterized membrane protein (DUF485 family)
MGSAADGQEKEETTVATNQVDWQAIDSRADFQELHRKKTSFLWGLMVFSMVYYFLLPLGAAYAPNLFKVKVWGVVNVGLLFALSQFVVAWALAYYYAKTASARFDPMADKIAGDVAKMMGESK